MAQTFDTPKLYADHLPEPHRTVNPDRTVTETELPGFISVGVVIGGVKKELARFKAGSFLNDLAAAKKKPKTSDE